MVEQITITLKVEHRRFGSVALLAGGLLCMMGLERLGGWMAMLGLRGTVT